MQRWAIGILLVLFLFGIGCGPKYAKKETLSLLEEARLAAEKAEAKVKDLEAEIASLKEKISSLKEELNELTQERDALKEKISSRCGK
ncbi:hypothetical protein DRP53_00035 [candidate division WOR-3 bacterium]|uniref:Uncharacterized protein n=1 Tax=candidate division WOR-3 bacterium TaxID=2052148 RepID=A0A660SNY8_UNCW3|nr:MAG: hypothetical protein DRP53_00035 [candidate division WOR-3 bacterium]